MDLNVQIIQAVECFPLLYKGHATIEERQAVWQQISEELRVSESVLKSRWHILCGYYQRSLEKRRSTDEEGNGDDGSMRTDFRYEKEMAFMMPYMHARIAIAAANAARKQQELAAAGNKELTDPEFIITERDLENATKLNNNLNEEYIFYDVETLDGDSQIYQQHQHHMDGNSLGDGSEEDDESHEQHIVQTIHEDINEVIEEVDESENIVVQDLIIESGELVSEDGEQIVVEDEEVLQMDDQIETVIEEVVENTSGLEEMQEHTHTHTSTAHDELEAETVVFQGHASPRVLRMPAGTNGQKFAKIIQETASTTPTYLEHEVQQQNKHLNRYEPHEQQIIQSPPSFAQEYAVMTRRRRAVVLKATPRVQVELTDNAAANADTHAIELQDNNIEGAALDVAANAIVVGDNSDLTKNATKENTTIARHHHQQQQQQQQQQKRGLQERLGENSHDSSSDHDNRSNDSNVVTTTAAENDEEHSTKGERSEDTIFGELVTAMLKHMPQERKRSIKKSIMDLLLT